MKQATEKLKIDVLKNIEKYWKLIKFDDPVSVGIEITENVRISDGGCM